MVKGRNPRKREESRLIAPLERAGHFYAILFCFTTFHDVTNEIPYFSSAWKGLNKIRQNQSFSNKRDYKMPTFSTRPRISETLTTFPTCGVHSLCRYHYYTNLWKYHHNTIMVHHYGSPLWLREIGWRNLYKIRMFRRLVLGWFN
jgi:hypothetical protein